MIVQTFISVLALIVTLGILVTIHEFGHYWVARRCGVKVLRFSVGFGRAIKTWKGKDGVEFVIAPIPLGGYVKMLGQEDTKVALTDDVSNFERHLSFSSKSPLQKALIAVAGPAANFLLAIFVFWVLNLSYGESGIAPVISGLEDESPALLAGLKEGDEILAVDGKVTLTWQQVNLHMLSRLGETGDLRLTIRTISNTTADVNLPIQAWMADELEPNPISSLGILQFSVPPVIGGVIDAGPADKGGLRAGDTVISVNGREVGNWSSWVKEIRANPELELEVIVQRNDNQMSLSLVPEVNYEDGAPAFGTIGAFAQQASLSELVPTEMQRNIVFGPISAIMPALQETWDKSLFVLGAIKKMVIGLISVKNINGPITIAQVAGETATYGLEIYLGFLALLSISLGVMNLLPIPVLDGGQILFCFIEAVIRRPVPEKIQAWGLQLGLFIISSIMILAIYNDFNRFL
tara:strand:- start:988 stop:2376 length:1389 start_codon:yes stop_codon:yes gene_type:complete